VLEKAKKRSVHFPQRKFAIKVRSSPDATNDMDFYVVNVHGYVCANSQLQA
jgi:hypothetical protein